MTRALTGTGGSGATLDLARLRVEPGAIGGGATPPGEFTCPTCGCFIGQRIENGVAVTRCQQCAPEPVPDDAVERTLLSLQSRWAHAECSREQVASEALDIIRQLSRDFAAEREKLRRDVQRLRDRIDEYANDAGRQW